MARLREFTDRERNKIYQKIQPGKDTHGARSMPDGETFNDFLETCQALGLNPLLDEINLICRGGQWRVEPSINGLLRIAHESEGFAGIGEPSWVWSPDAKATKVTKKGGGGEEIIPAHPDSATATVFKAVVIGDQVFMRPFSHTVWWSDYGSVKSTWANQPAHMLYKTALAGVLRYAFGHLRGLYVAEEFGDVSADDAALLAMQAAAPELADDPDVADAAEGAEAPAAAVVPERPALAATPAPASPQPVVEGVLAKRATKLLVAAVLGKNPTWVGDQGDGIVQKHSAAKDEVNDFILRVYGPQLGIPEGADLQGWVNHAMTEQQGLDLVRLHPGYLQAFFCVRYAETQGPLPAPEASQDADGAAGGRVVDPETGEELNWEAEQGAFVASIELLTDFYTDVGHLQVDAPDESGVATLRFPRGEDGALIRLSVPDAVDLINAQLTAVDPDWAGKAEADALGLRYATQWLDAFANYFHETDDPDVRLAIDGDVVMEETPSEPPTAA